jgi:hypothetical protein
MFGFPTTLTETQEWLAVFKIMDCSCPSIEMMLSVVDLRSGDLGIGNRKGKKVGKSNCSSR